MALKFTKLSKPIISRLGQGKVTEHGITFERLKNGDGKFSINVMVDGQRIHRTIGKESEGVTRKQAETFIEQVKTESRAGRLNLPKGRKLVLGFSEASQKYLEKQEQGGGKDLKMKKMRLEHNLIPFFGDKPLSNISSFEVERFKKFRLDQGKAPGTVNRDLAVLSHLFTKAVEWGWIDHRPNVIKRLKEDPGRITYLTTCQLVRLRQAAKEDYNRHIFPFINIGLDTGMRRMEILSIQVKNIYPEKQIIYVPKGKAGAREQPITKELAKFLKGYLQSLPPDQKWLFPSEKSKTGHVVAIEKPFRRIVRKAGLDLKEVVRHTLRHTAITHLVQEGVDLPTVSRISGHKTLSMVARYSHQNGAHIQAAMDKLEKKYKAV